jgi:hypothetical protein
LVAYVAFLVDFGEGVQDRIMLAFLMLIFIYLLFTNGIKFAASVTPQIIP